MRSAISIAKVVIPGLLTALALSLVTATLSRAVSRIPSFYLDPLFLGLLLGLLVRWLIGERFVFWPGFGFAQDIFIPVGVLLYATQVRWNIFSLSAMKQFFIPVVLAFAIYYFFLVRPASRFNLSKPAALLIWTSLALLGPIGVVLLAPALQTTDEETSLSLLLAAFATSLMLALLPMISHFYGFNMATLGALSTLSLPLLSPENPATIGMPGAIAYATFLFGIKVALLGPIALAIYFTHRSSRSTTPKLPLAVIAIFIAIGVLFTLLPALSALSESFHSYSRFALTLAMVAVGLSTDLRHLFVGKNKLVAIYLLLTSAAALTAFVLESLSMRYLPIG